MNNRSVIPAPEWLKERMRKLKQRPPPKIEDVILQWEASARFIQELDDNLGKDNRKYVR